MGRVTSTERRDNLVITVSTTNGVSSSQLTNPGTLLSTTSSLYNDLGQVTQSTDAANQITKYQYDSAGRQSSVTDALNEVTSSTYNVAGQLIFSSDSLNHVTQRVYDRDLRIVKTIIVNDNIKSQQDVLSYGNESSVASKSFKPLGAQTLGEMEVFAYVVIGRDAMIADVIGTNPRLTTYSVDLYFRLTSMASQEGTATYV